MRRLLVIAAFLLASLPAVAAGAERGAIRGVIVRGDTGEAERGVIVRGDTGEAERGVIVTLTVVGRGERSTTRTITDDHGRYRFDGLRTGDDFGYAVDARYDGGLFPGRTLQLPSDTTRRPVIDTRLKVWPTTTDPRSVLVRRDDSFLTPYRNTLSVISSVTIVNTTDRAYIGRAAKAQDAATFAFALPAGAAEETVSIQHSDIDIPRLVATDPGFGVTVAIPPGETKVVFSYSVTGTGGAYVLTRPALYPTLDLAVYATEPIAIESDRLVPGDDETIGDTVYRTWRARDTVEAGDLVRVEATAESDPSSMLLWAAVAGAFAVAALAGSAYALRRRATRRLTRAARPERRDLLVEIARLDLLREAGDLDDEEWARRRAELKDRLEPRQPEPLR